MMFKMVRIRNQSSSAKHSILQCTSAKQVPHTQLGAPTLRHATNVAPHAAASRFELARAITSVAALSLRGPSRASSVTKSGA